MQLAGLLLWPARFLIESSESYETGRDALEPVGRDVLIWRMTGFGDAQRVEQAIRRARAYKGLVIDMRGNGGGLVDTERKLVELTFDRPVTIVTEKPQRYRYHDGQTSQVTFYATSITVGDVRMSDGSGLEKIGVTPDELVLPTGADLAADRDPALARAVALAGGTLTPEQAGKLSRKS